MAKHPPPQTGSRSRRPTAGSDERLPRELFADEDLSADHERRKHAPLREEEQRKRLELASLAKLNERGESAVAVGRYSAALVVEGGKHKGEKAAFGREGASLGRSSKCTLTLRMGAGVSRNHAQIVFDEVSQGFVLEDLGSRNGTGLNGATITGPTLLRDRDLIEISAERIRYVGPSPAQRSDDDNAMPAPGFSLDESPPPSAFADVTAPSAAPVPRAPRRADDDRDFEMGELPPPPVADVEELDDFDIVDEAPQLPPPLSPPPSPPLHAPRIAADVDLAPTDPPSMAELSVPAPVAPGAPEPQTSALPPALGHPATPRPAPTPPKGGGGSSVMLFALGLFLGVTLIGAAFAIDAFVLDGKIARSVLGLVGFGGTNETPAPLPVPEGPTVDVTSRSGGEIKSVRVLVGDTVKNGDVLGTISRGGPEDPVAHAKLLAEKARLKELSKSKRKKTRKVAAAKLATVTAAIAKAEAAPTKVYNLRSDRDGVVKELLVTVGQTVAPGAPIARLVTPGGPRGDPPQKKPAPEDDRTSVDADQAIR